MHSLIVQHKGSPDRMSRWTWKSVDSENVKWIIDSWLDGYYQPGCHVEGIATSEDFESDLESLENLSPEMFEVKRLY